MGEVRVVYADLEDAISYASETRKKMQDYIDAIEKIFNPLSQSTNDPGGFIQAAVNAANQKKSDLISKKTYFSNLETSLENVIAEAKSIDSLVSDNISTIAENYIEEREWYEAIGDWCYNTFCVDIPNRLSIVRDFVDGIKWVGDKVGNVLKEVHDWFKYGDGKYVWNIAKSIVGVVAAVGGTILAFASIPFTGGLSIPVVIASIGFAASAVATFITIIDSTATTILNSKALLLSDDIFDDDDGDPGAARYYGSTSKISEYYEKIDFGDQADNDEMKELGKKIDRTKLVADSVDLVCNIASLGNVKDFSITSGSNIDFSYNAGKFNSGYNWSWDNIKINLLDDLGIDTVTGKFKKGAFKFNIIAKDDFTNPAFDVSQKATKFFNYGKTTDDIMSMAEDLDGLYDFYTEPDKTFDGLKETMGHLTGLGKSFGKLSFFDKYLTKPIKLGGEYVDLVSE